MTNNKTSASRSLRSDVTSLAGFRARQANEQPHLLPREQLLERFNQASRALTLVHAPMGYGKTTLLRQFLAARQARRACHWLTLSEHDNDIDHFAGRLEQVFARSTPQDARHSAFERLESVLLGTPFCLFLDEFECIVNEGVLSFMRELLKRLGSGSEIILGSRSIPAIGVPRLRAKGAVLEITAHQLSFTPDEIRRLLQTRAGHTLSDQQLALLHRRSGGWAAFIGLFGSSFDGPLSDEALHLRMGAGGASMGNLISRHVLEGLATDTRQFIGDSSILGEFEVDLCDHALGRHDSRERIAGLERQQLFISRVDPLRERYRYHSLFADILQRGISTERRREIHRRAGQWYVLRGQPVAAVNHLLQADCVDQAIRVIEQISQDLLAQGRSRLLLRWFDQLPAERVRNHQALTLTLSWALGLSRRHAEMQQQLGALAEEASLLPGQQRECQAIRAVSLAMIDRTHESLALLQQEPDLREEAYPLHQQVMLHIVIYGLIARNDFAAAHQALARSLDSGQDRRESFTRVMANSFSAAIDLIQGRLSTALGQLASAPAAGASAHLLYRHGSRSLNDVTLAIALYERNELDRCQQLLSELLPLVAENGTPDQLVYAHLLMARIHALRQEPNLANEYLDELDALSCVHDIPRLSSSAWLGRAWMAWKHGDLAGANYAYRRATAQMGQPGAGLLVVYQHESDWPAMMQLRLAVEGKVTTATLDELKKAIATARQEGRVRRSLELHILLARAHLNLGHKDDQALELLAAPLRHAINQGYTRLFLDEGPDICRLALRWCETNRALLRNDSGQDPLLEHFMLALGQALAEDARQPQDNILLSPREIEVLRLLETGMRNTEMAEKLFVSETTVRTHLRSINAKLGARSRTEAVSLARHMHLI
ncbi:LuxR family transcriptional regulator [Pseudomonas sp. S31]|uniref:LuxR C-terminal-related transcriptional regulator n=1 Tax=Pseudomonas sp. S31 TaxID=1564473 RepID=UPI00191271D4|nr:LuxR C-terminal-related transcriptional regulator [Pseudomonas sp. S31]MBK4998761.1 LuxR family transcriptional regulator [Pseudomonas sp. S31]